MIENLIIIFLLNTLSNCIGTLKTIFISKQMSKPAYFVAFSDAVLFSYTLKLVSDSSNPTFILVFAFGKVFGMYIADWIEKKMALGLLEIAVYTNKQNGKELADFLRSQNYSVTTQIGYGLNGKEKLLINIIIKRKDYDKLRKLLKEYNENVTMAVTEIKNITGKLAKEKIMNNSLRAKAV
jgi:uncharacterized protein YebE (UPF0316 family)